MFPLCYPVAIYCGRLCDEHGTQQTSKRSKNKCQHDLFLDVFWLQFLSQPLTWNQRGTQNASPSPSCSIQCNRDGVPYRFFGGNVWCRYCRSISNHKIFLHFAVSHLVLSPASSLGSVSPPPTLRRNPHWKPTWNPTWTRSTCCSSHWIVCFVYILFCVDASKSMSTQKRNRMNMEPNGYI